MSMSSQAPRPPHPPPASPAIARVLPMVPEVSLFLQGQAQPLLGPRHPASSPPPPCSPRLTSHVEPPRPHLPPSHHLVPQSDLSREFLRSEATLFLSGSSDIPARRVQFQADSPHQQGGHQQGGHHHGQGQADRPDQQGRHHQDNHYHGKAQPNRISFPHRVQHLPHNTVQVQPHHIPALERQTALLRQPHSTAQAHGQYQALPAYHESPTPLPSTTQHQLPTTIHPDIMSVLSWQNDQLAKLQDQVTRLLAASPQGQAQHAGHPTPGHGVHGPRHQPEIGNSPMLKRVSSPPTGKTSVSTSTSTLLPDIQSPMIKLIEESKTLPSLQSQPVVCLDLPEYPVSPSGSTNSGLKRGAVDMNTLDSPVLGESASMYEGNTSTSDNGQDNVEMMYENILGQVKRLLAQDPEQYQPVDAGGGDGSETQEYVHTARQQFINTQDCPPPISIQEPNQHQPPPRHGPVYPVSALPIHPVSALPIHPVSAPPVHPVSAQSTTTATWDRLRQLGVSFISPSDLAPPSSPANPYNSIFLPRANLPSSTMISPSPNTSLAINNMALKYLSDTELAQLAGQHSRQTQVAAAQKGPAEYSMASHQFLARYGLGAGHAGGQGQGFAHHTGGQSQEEQHYNITRSPQLPARPQQHPPPNSTPSTPLPARPQQYHPPNLTPSTPLTSRAAAAAPVMDRVLDITAIRLQEKLC